MSNRELDWAGLAKAIRDDLASRDPAWSQQMLADRVGVDLRTIQSLLAGNARVQLPYYLDAVDAAIEWPTDTCLRILQRRPMSLDDVEARIMAMDDIPLRRRRQLVDLYRTVLQVSTTQPNAG